MSNSLYEIRCRFVELMNNDEISDEEKLELGQEIAKELQNKSGNIIAYIVDSESLLVRIKEEENRLEALRKKGEQKLEKFKEYVQENMKALGLEDSSIKTEFGTMSIAKNPMSVEIEDEKAIPAEFIKTKVTTSIDKTAIKEHFKNTGEVVAGAKIITNKTTLRIK